MWVVIQFATVVITGVEKVADLGQAEGDGQVGADGRPHHLAGVAVNAGRDIQADDRTMAGIHAFDDVGIMAAHRFGKTGPQNGIDDQIAGGYQVIQSRRGRIGHGVDTQSLNDLPIDGRGAAVAGGVTQQQHQRLAAVGENFTGYHQTVAAVIAAAAEHQDASASDRKAIPQHPVGCQSGVFHEQGFGNAEIFDGALIHRTHLGNGGDFHGAPPVPMSR